VRWLRFRNRRIRPAVEAIDARVDETTAGVKRWFSGWGPRQR
jgi:hypothetical protein